MKKQFAGSGFRPLGYVALFIVFALVPLSQRLYGVALIPVLLAGIYFLQFAFKFRIYIVTDDEFYTTKFIRH
jgi:hypothetical protein